MRFRLNCNRWKRVATDPAQCLRLLESLADFRSGLQRRADTQEVTERPKMLRLLVKEILVGKETLTICHSIRKPTGGSDPQPPTPQPDPHYLLRSDRIGATLW
jgi:site-specific DNA recombinase